MKQEPFAFERKQEAPEEKHAPLFSPQKKRIDELQNRFGITDPSAIAKALRISEKLAHDALKSKD